MAHQNVFRTREGGGSKTSCNPKPTDHLRLKPSPGIPRHTSTVRYRYLAGHTLPGPAPDPLLPCSGEHPLTHIGDSRRYVSFVNTVASALRRGRRWEAYRWYLVRLRLWPCAEFVLLCFTPSQSRAALVRGIDLRNSCASVTHSSTSAFAHRATYSSSLLVESTSRFTFAITST